VSQIQYPCPNPDCGRLFYADHEQEEVFCPRCGEEVRYALAYDPDDARNNN
jgi:ribosomal protein S27AE